MNVTEHVNGWTYATFPLATPAATFGRFQSAVALWRAKARPDGLPRKQDFRAEDFRPWMGWTIIYEVVPEPFDLRFRLFGSYLSEGLDIENTGKLFSEAYAHASSHSVTLLHFRRLWRDRMIGMSTGPMNWEGRDFSFGLFVDLPVADDAGNPAYFFTFACLGDKSVSAEMPGSQARCDQGAPGSGRRAAMSGS